MTNTSLTIGFMMGALRGRGGEKTILTLAKALLARQHAVDIFVLENVGDYAVPEGVRIVVIPGANPREKMQGLASLTQTGKHDLFICTHANFYASVATPNKYLSVHITPTAMMSHPRWQFWKTWKKKRKLSRKYQGKRLIALSEGTADDLVFNLGCRRDDITVINNPFELDVMQAMAGETHDIPEGRYIIYVASFVSLKRHRDLLQAFARLKDQNVQLLLLGKGPLEQDIHELASRLGLLPRILFREWDSNPYRLIRHSCLSMLVSDAEGMPRVLVESLLLGVPVVSTDCRSGPREILTGELAKFLVPVGDIERLAQAIDKALQDYPPIDPQAFARFEAGNVADRYVQLALAR